MSHRRKPFCLVVELLETRELPAGGVLSTGLPNLPVLPTADPGMTSVVTTNAVPTSIQPAVLAPAAANSWNWSRTRVIFFSFADGAAADQQLVDRFTALVPNGNVTTLRGSAQTIAALETAIQNLSSQTAAGDSLVLYFNGHGFLGNSDEPGSGGISVNGVFLTYETVLNLIESNFKGQSVFIATDACYAEQLNKFAAMRAATLTKQYAILAASSDNTLTNNDTNYRDTLLRALRGDPAADMHQRGIVTFGDLGQYADARLTAVSGVRPVFSTVGLSKDIVLSTVAGFTPLKRGDQVQIRLGQEFVGATIVAVRAGAQPFQVRYKRGRDTVTAWVSAAEIWRVQPKYFGQAVSVAGKRAGILDERPIYTIRFTTGEVAEFILREQLIATGPIKVGTRVQIDVPGEGRLSAVVTAIDTQYLAHFTALFLPDEWVTRAQIHVFHPPQFSSGALVEFVSNARIVDGVVQFIWSPATVVRKETTLWGTVLYAVREFDGGAIIWSDASHVRTRPPGQI